MKDKYYTPEIEEFHVGFEYESSYLEDYDTWKKEIIDTVDVGYFYSIYTGDAVPTEFRVKYLDREDIESLGFYLQYPDLSSSPFINKDIYKDNACIIDIRSNNIVSITKCNHPNTSTLVFKIKNKSELKRLLKQLNI